MYLFYLKISQCNSLREASVSDLAASAEESSNTPKHPDLILRERTGNCGQVLHGNSGQALQVHLWAHWSVGWKGAARDPEANGQPSTSGIILEHPLGTGIE